VRLRQPERGEITVRYTGDTALPTELTGADGQRVAKLVDGQVVALHLGGAYFDTELGYIEPITLAGRTVALLAGGQVQLTPTDRVGRDHPSCRGLRQYSEELL
jgi:hypothetical protein